MSGLAGRSEHALMFLRPQFHVLGLPVRIAAILRACRYRIVDAATASIGPWVWQTGASGSPRSHPRTADGCMTSCSDASSTRGCVRFSSPLQCSATVPVHRAFAIASLLAREEEVVERGRLLVLTEVTRPRHPLRRTARASGSWTIPR